MNWIAEGVENQQKHNEEDWCVTAGPIINKPPLWGVNAASLVHDSLSVSFWTAEMSPAIRWGAQHTTCHHEIMNPCLAAQAERRKHRCDAKG